jgi:pseudaminic acid synthase
MNNKTFIVAEISANHNQSLELAYKTIMAAKEAGADAVKLQTYTPDSITIDCNALYFMTRENGLWSGQTLYSLYKKACTPYEWHEPLFKYANDLGLVIFSTPFDIDAVDFLEKLGNPIYKIASFELVDVNLIRHAAKLGKPMFMSTGIADEDEVKNAVEVCREVGNNDITLLQCTSEYPANLDNANLCMLQDMAKRFNVKTGLSDHTIGILASIAAVAMGACVIEKHFILDRSLGGPDSVFSIEPAELKNLVNDIRSVEKAIGVVDYSTTFKEASRRYMRSLFVVRDIDEGESLTNINVKSIRPGNGLAPKYLSDVLGKKAKANIRRGTPLSWDVITNS